MLKTQQVLLKANEVKFIQENKKDLFSVIRTLILVWLVIGLAAYFTFPQQSITQAHTLIEELYYISDAFLIGCVVSVATLPIAITYQHKALKSALLANLLVILAILLSIQFAPATEAQESRYEGCLNQLLSLTDHSKEQAILGARNFDRNNGGRRTEQKIQECQTQVLNAVASINNDLYSRIKTEKHFSMNEIAAISTESTIRSFTKSEEDKMVSCLNELLAGDEFSINNANWILDDLAKNGMTQSPQQHITHCYSNLALSSGKLAQNKRNLTQMIADHRTSLKAVE